MFGVKRLELDAFFLRAIVYTVTLNWKPAILLKPEIVHNWSEKNIWVYSFAEIGDGFLLF